MYFARGFTGAAKKLADGTCAVWFGFEEIPLTRASVAFFAVACALFLGEKHQNMEKQPGPAWLKQRNRLLF